MADPDHLQQVFLNLILNALDATQKGGTVRITSGSDPTLPSEGRAGILRARRRADAGHSRNRHRQGADRRGAKPRLRAVLLYKTAGKGAVWAGISEEIVRAHRGEIEMLSIRGRHRSHCSRPLVTHRPLDDDGARAWH